jgi:hypothetical protein
VECFRNCTQLCKPHESNKVVWDIYQNISNEDYVADLLKQSENISNTIKHKEFI